MENSLEISLSQQQYELIEKLAQLFDKEGLQSGCGRIFGLLMVSDAEELTFDQIVAALKISKSSASVAINNLLLFDKIEYFTRPGDRKRYFRIKEVAEDTIFSDLQKRLTVMSDISKSVLAIKGEKDSRNARIIKRMRKVTKYFLGIMENINSDLKDGKDVFGFNS